jgi:dehydrogenase/reductase SDR family protein 12
MRRIDVIRPGVVLLDGALDRSLVLGYTKIGSGLRRRWWPAGPASDSMVGKRVLVCGATSGIGLEMARAFTGLGAVVHLLGRNPAKVRERVADISAGYPDAAVFGEVCDVSDLDAVTAWTADFANRVPALDGLVHNAGLMPRQRYVTAQGHELQLATHILGPHLMTERLMLLLRAVRGSSVVFVSSGGMYSTTLGVDDLESDRNYSGVRTYAKTKRMQVVLADAWAHRMVGTGVKVESMHPGWVDTPGVAAYLPRFRAITRPLLREVADGADTAVWLVATRPDSKPGHFWHDRAQRPTTYGWQRRENPATVRRFLYRVSELTGTSKSWT